MANTVRGRPRNGSKTPARGSDQAHFRAGLDRNLTFFWSRMPRRAQFPGCGGRFAGASGARGDGRRPGDQPRRAWTGRGPARDGGPCLRPKRLYARAGQLSTRRRECVRCPRFLAGGGGALSAGSQRDASNASGGHGFWQRRTPSIGARPPVGPRRAESFALLADLRVKLTPLHDR